jgi:hypothetical protein
MRPRFSLPIALAVLLLAPALAFAQSTDPIVYVCTPDAVIYKVVGTTSTKLYTGTGRFDHCDVGPDGYLYVLNNTKILRLNPTSKNTASSSAEFVGPELGSDGRGAAFNASAYYINTASTGVVKVTTTPAVPLIFSNMKTQLTPLNSPGEGRDLLFDVRGNLIFIQGGAVYRIAPPYLETPTPLVSDSAFGLALDTCRQVVFTDTVNRKVNRIVEIVDLDPPIDPPQFVVVEITGVNLAGGSNPEIPLDASFDTQGRLYLLAGPNVNGTNTVKLYRYLPVSAVGTQTTCASVTNKTQLFSDNKAIGVAVGPDNVSITNTFSSSDCQNGSVTKKYDFGYHAVTLTFPDCTNTFPSVPPNQITNFTITAVKAMPSETNFSSAFPASTEGMQYSPMGDFVVQHLLSISGYNPFAGPPPSTHPLELIYHFFTQVIIHEPGVGSAADHATTADFTTKVGTDYWEAGILDPPAGERGDTCCSKRVVFNAPTQNNNGCTLSFGSPLQTAQPQRFQFGQNITLNVNVQGGCTGGTLRVDIHEDLPAEFVKKAVTSNVETDNMMSPNGPSSFIYHLLNILPPGNYVVTVSGTAGAPISHKFFVQ